MNLLQEWAKKMIPEVAPEELELGEKVGVAPRIHAVFVEALDEIARKAGMSRTGLAAEILELGIVEVGRVVGVGVFPGEPPEGYHVGLFDTALGVDEE